MNNQTIQNQIDDHMKTLPTDVQNAIKSSSWERKILTIGRKYGLHVDQLEVLQVELSLAVLGLTGRDEFVREVMSEAKISKETMNLIVEDINHEIFEPIRNYLHTTRINEEEREISLSGLEKKEEETLSRHGVSFDVSSEDAIPTSTSVEPNIFSTPKPEIQKAPETQNPQIIHTISTIEDIIPEYSQSENAVENTENIAKSQEISGEKVPVILETIQNPQVAQVEQPTKPVEETPVDTFSFKSAQTFENQKTINNAKTVNYPKTDPYREPI